MAKRKPQPSPLTTATPKTIAAPDLITAAEAAEAIEGWLILIGDMSELEELFDLPEAVPAAAADLYAAYEATYGSDPDYPLHSQKRQLGTDLCKALDEGDRQAASVLADQLADMEESGLDPYRQGDSRPRPTSAKVEAMARRWVAAIKVADAQQRRYAEAKARLSVACQGWEEAEVAIPLLDLISMCSTGDLGSLHVSTDAHWWHRAAVNAMDEGISADRITVHCVKATGRQLPGQVAEALAQYEATRGGEDKKAAARARCWADLRIYTFFAR